MFQALLGTFAILVVLAATISLLALAFASRKQEFCHKVRLLAGIFSLILLAVSAVFAIVYFLASPFCYFEPTAFNIGSLWGNLAACLLGSLLIHMNNGNSAERHVEATLFTILAYSQCVLSACYVALFVSLFGPGLGFACVVADCCINAIYLIFPLLLWVYACVTAGFRKPWVSIASKVFAALVAIGVLMLASDPFTGVFIVADPIACDTVTKPAYAVLAIAFVPIIVGLLIVAASGNIPAVEKAALAVLIASIPLILFLEFVVCLYVSGLILGVALGYCYFGIADRRAQSMQRHMAQVDMAFDIQQGMLPQAFPDDPRFEVYAHMWPAKEVAGDFYDFYQLDCDHVYIAVADVSGKDVPAAMFMAKAHALIREHESRGMEPNEIFNRVNAALAEGNSEKLFVTAWLGKVDLASGQVTYANAGHNPPILVKDGSVGYLRTKVNLILGIRKRSKYVCQTLQLEKGDRILLYTDGVTESINTAEEQYGEDRLLEFVKTMRGSTGKETAEGIFDSVNRFAAGMEQFDDVTVLSACYRGDAEGGEC